MSTSNDLWFDVTATGLARAMGVPCGAAQVCGVANLAKELKVSRQYVYAALQRGYLPLPRAKQVSALTGVPTRELIDPKMRAAVEG